MTELKEIEEIKSELVESKGELLLEYDFDAFDEKYFNVLVKELPNFKVNEIRPRQKIWITKGVNTEILNNHLSQLLTHMISYNELRTEVFSEFMSRLGINKIEGDFYKLRVKLQSLDAWPKGNFENWNYWSHGGDIEFDNTQNSDHFNVRMSNIKSIKYWSIHKYISNSCDESKESEFIINHKDAIPKMFDLMVLQNMLTVKRTQFGEKQYELVLRYESI